MWNLIRESVRGTAHLRDGLPCQDSSFGLVTRPASDEILVLACADGAGSAELSEHGSRIACETFVRAVVDALEAGSRIEDIDRNIVMNWYRAVVSAIDNEASDRGVARRQLACTLLTAVVGRSASVFAQIGDGAIVFKRADEYTTAFWPQSGEYVNLTHFVTDDNLNESLQFAQGEGTDEIALLSDGLQMLALNYATKAVHRDFFRSMFDALRTTTEPDELVIPLRQFLDSPQVNARTDDDKTLVLAARSGVAAR